VTEHELEWDEHLGRTTARAADKAEPGHWMFIQATAFHEGALRCLAPRVTSSGFAQIAVAPGVTCLAFAAELYLKVLHTISGPTPHGHRLQDLFEQLSQPLRKSIEARYERLTERTATHFAKDLQAISNTFVLWRYVFERDESHLYVEHLQYFAKALFEELVQLKPLWAPEDAKRLGEIPGLAG
jgi:hypothetical protein